MEFRGVYVLWFLLPFWYGCLTLWVFLRPYFKVSGKEKFATYSGSFVYTVLCFVFAIILDQAGIMNPVESFFKSMGWFGEKLDIGVVRFLLYPFILVLGAKIQQLAKKETKQRKKNLPKSKWDM